MQKQENRPSTWHRASKHHKGYDFKALCEVLPALKPVVFEKEDGVATINFTDTEAVKLLNTALLKLHYGIQYWEFPADYLCPGIPGRADYLLYLNDLLSEDALYLMSKAIIRGFDIGTGANCIYPLLGNALYNWQFVASESDEQALSSAQSIVNANGLSESITVRPQNDMRNLFKGILKGNERFHFSMCNPPFHSSAAEAAKANKRKWNKLDKPKTTHLNFGGKDSELWCEGGELQFIQTLIKESVECSKQVLWFTTLVSKQDNLPRLIRALKKLNGVSIKVIEMQHGQKQSRILAWTFCKLRDRMSWFINPEETAL